MTVKSKTTLGIGLVACLVLAGFMFLGAGSIGKQMKSLKYAYASTMSSNSIDEFKSNFQKFEVAAKQAANMSLKGSAQEQATYQKGMQELQSEIDQVNAAINRGDLDGAKAVMKQANDTKKAYHKALGV